MHVPQGDVASEGSAVGQWCPVSSLILADGQLRDLEQVTQCAGHYLSHLSLNGQGITCLICEMKGLSLWLGLILVSWEGTPDGSIATLPEAAWEVAWRGARLGAERACQWLWLSSRGEAGEARARVIVQTQGEKSRSRIYLEGDTLIFSLLLDQGTHVANFILILVRVKHVLGNQVEMSRKKLDIWFLDFRGEGSVPEMTMCVSQHRQDRDMERKDIPTHNNIWVIVCDMFKGMGLPRGGRERPKAKWGKGKRTMWHR